MHGVHGSMPLQPAVGVGYPNGSSRLLTANFSVVDLYRMMRTEGFAEGLTRGLLDRSCMYGVCGSIPTQPAVRNPGHGFRIRNICTIVVEGVSGRHID